MFQAFAFGTCWSNASKRPLMAKVLNFAMLSHSWLKMVVRTVLWKVSLGAQLILWYESSGGFTSCSWGHAGI